MKMKMFCCCEWRNDPCSLSVKQHKPKIRRGKEFWTLYEHILQVQKCQVSEGEVSVCYLQEVDVRINHRVAEVRLDIGHGLTFNLQPVSHPHVTVDLRQASLHKQTHRQRSTDGSHLLLTHSRINIITPSHDIKSHASSETRDIGQDLWQTSATLHNTMLSASLMHWWTKWSLVYGRNILTPRPNRSIILNYKWHQWA